jgi:transposase-like protein
VQPNAHGDLREIWLSPNRAAAEAAMATFAEKYAPKYQKAVDCLLKDRDALLTFFDFPAEHWTHPRTSNPIESAFATVRHRTVRMKGALWFCRKFSQWPRKAWDDELVYPASA